MRIGFDNTYKVEPILFSFMKGHNYGECRKCGKIHIHPRGTLGKKIDLSKRKSYQGENNPFYGKIHSDKTKKILSEKCKGLIPWNKGILRKESTKKKISITRKESGIAKLENNPNWRGGVSFIDYPYEFYQIREKILKRDNFTCQKCNSKDDLTIHHVNHNKEDNTEENLLTLCRSCNSKDNKESD